MEQWGRFVDAVMMDWSTVVSDRSTVVGDRCMMYDWFHIFDRCNNGLDDRLTVIVCAALMGYSGWDVLNY